MSKTAAELHLTTISTCQKGPYEGQNTDKEPQKELPRDNKLLTVPRRR